MNKIFRILAGAALATAVISSNALAGATITGAGATFPYPIYAKWAYSYNKQTGVQLNYQSIGSGGGVKQISAGTVDFGASDAPLTPAELDKKGLTQFPMVIGGVVPVVKLAGIQANQIKLTGELLSAIFRGKVTKWNDPAITALNPGVKLPGTAITVVHRADGSGTTWIFTNYLTKVSSGWARTVGNDKSVEWPVGLGGKGNEGVAAYVTQTEGAIGYVEYAYALQNKLTTTLMQNAAGQFVAANDDNFQAAAASANWAKAPGFYMVLTQQPGAASWPITGASFILMQRVQRNAAQGKAVLSFFDWCYTNGAKEAAALNYVPMPQSVSDLVEKSWKANLRGADGSAIW